MRTSTSRLLSAAWLSLALLAPVTITPNLHAADQNVYRDERRHEEHHWDKREDKAYHMWAKETHRKYRDFGKLNAEERQSYWDWRHDHSDALLKINIH